MRASRQDGELILGAGGAVESGVTLAAAEQLGELDDVFEIDGISIRENERRRPGAALTPTAVAARAWPS